MRPSSLAVLLSVLLVSACLPENLKKYQRGNNSADSRPSAASAINDPVAADIDTSPSTTTAGDRAAARREEAPRATIYALDKQTFRFLVAEADVWESALNVLLRNYNVTIVDKGTGIITTEWDSYYLNGAVYRNKVSLRVSRSNRSQVDVTIHNNVEKLKDASQAGSGTVGAVWLPTDDLANEIARLVQNMALVLNQPPPVLPPNMNGTAVARDLTEPSNVKR